MIRVGKIVATHGLNGSLILTHIVGNSKWLKKGQALLVEMQKGSFIPYFVDQCNPKNDEEYLVNIENIDKMDEAKKLVTKHVYVDESVLAGYETQSPLLWIGFTLTDKTKGIVGTIEDVVQAGVQWLAKLTYQDKEVLVPLVPQMILKLDIKAKTLAMDLPEGLLEVYL